MQRLEVSVTLRQGRDYDMDREGTYVIQPGGAASAPCGGKVTGTKDELEDRLQEVLNSNDRGWSRKMKGVAGDFTYLDAGAHRHVYKGVYQKGPRKGKLCVKKVFKGGSVYSSAAFSHDLKVTQEAAPIIAAFNRVYGVTVTLNEPEVWTNLSPDSTGNKQRLLRQHGQQAAVAL